MEMVDVDDSSLWMGTVTDQISWLSLRVGSCLVLS